NQINDGNATATQEDIDELKSLFDTFFFDILGMRDESAGTTGDNGDSLQPYKDAVNLLLEMRSDAKQRKDWATSDLIRDRLAAMGFDVKDTKGGFEWSLK
ncbi:MAG: cysteine--tRNA ligase, partial [Bacteroidales bacterium]|nr:cysteine--tRNA ligase [Bacteroidales bacterium]